MLELELGNYIRLIAMSLHRQELVLIRVDIVHQSQPFT